MLGVAALLASTAAQAQTTDLVQRIDKATMIEMRRMAYQAVQQAAKHQPKVNDKRGNPTR